MLKFCDYSSLLQSLFSQPHLGMGIALTTAAIFTEEEEKEQRARKEGSVWEGR